MGFFLCEKRCLGTDSAPIYNYSKCDISFWSYHPPNEKHTHIHHKIHISCWWRHIHGFLWEERSSLDIWPCRQAAGRWSPVTACLCLHSLPETGSCSLEDILHTQKAWADHSTDHEHHLQKERVFFFFLTGYLKLKQSIRFSRNLPQILSGASSSSSIGWLRKISRDFRHNPRISFSVNWTFLPGLEPFTENEWHTKVNLTSVIARNRHKSIMNTYLCMYLFVCVNKSLSRKICSLVAIFAMPSGS